LLKRTDVRESADLTYFAHIAATSSTVRDVTN